MLNKIFFLPVFFISILSFSQQWKINTIVFSGTELTMKNQDQIFISGNNGFWKSNDFGLNFTYEYFRLNDGRKFFPAGFNSLFITEGVWVGKGSFDSKGNTPKFLVQYNTKKNTFTKISYDSLKHQIIKPFFSKKHGVLWFKGDSLFKCDTINWNINLLKVFNPQNNNLGGVSHFTKTNTNDFLISFETNSVNNNNEWVSEISIYYLDENTLSLESEFSFYSNTSWLETSNSESTFSTGQYGQIFKREDLSGNWVNIGLGKPFYVRSSFQTADTGVCYNANYFEGRNFYFTANGGTDWQEIELPKDLINVKGAAIKNNKVLVFGFDTVYQQTRLYQTDDITQHAVINTIKGGQPAPIGLTETITQNTINIYPNPTNQNFTIEANEIFKSVKLYNTIGQLVLATSPKQNITQIEVSHLPKGLYFLQIQQQNGASVLKKVVVN